MRKPPKWQYLKSAERQYSAELHRLVADIKTQAVELLYPALSQMMNDAQPLLRRIVVKGWFMYTYSLKKQ